MTSWFAELPPNLQDLVAVLLLGLFASVLFIPGRQDLKPKPAELSAWLEWGFGALVIGIRLFASTERPIQFAGVLVIGFVYVGLVAKTYLAYTAHCPTAGGELNGK